MSSHLSEYLEYYKTLYPESKITLKIISSYNKEDYKSSVKITANDPGPEGTISTAHLQEQVKPDRKYITLSEEKVCAIILFSIILVYTLIYCFSFFGWLCYND